MKYKLVMGSYQSLYLVKWLGYPENQNSWEPLESFTDPSIVGRFEDMFQKKEIDYEQMILDALSEIKERGGSSQETICTSIEMNYNIPIGFEEIVAKHLVGLFEDGKIDKIGKRFSLSKNPEMKVKKSKKTVKKSKKSKKSVK